MGRKFCKTLVKIVEKKGKVPCLHSGCKGYIRKGEEDFVPYSGEGGESHIYYQCTKVNKHKWLEVKDSFYENNPVFFEL